jgi:hypothetical protein
LAAERTMVGPPMSMFSIAVARSQSGRATVCGERIEVDHHQVDRRDAVRRHHGVVLAAAPEDAAVHRGCSVFTRPSIISGKPV